MEHHQTIEGSKPQWFPALFLTGAYAVLTALVFVAVRVAVGKEAGSSLPMPEPLFPWQAIVVIVAALLLGGIFLRKVKTRVAWELILGLVLLLGVWFYAWVTFLGDTGLLAASLLTLLQAGIRRIWMHNAFMLIGAAGATLYLAFLLPIGTLLVLLVGWAAYDTFAGRPGGVMARFAASLVHRGVVPGLVVPRHFQGLGGTLTQSAQQEHTLFLGAGELILPMLFVARAAAVGVWPGIAVGAGIVIAACWLGLRGTTRPVPALAPFAVGAGLPTVILLILRVL